MSTFDGTSATKYWARRCSAFFLLHPVVEKEAVEISVLHLKGEASNWWFSHVRHAKVSSFADFTQSMIKRFDKEKSEEEKSSPSLEETCISTITTLEEQPSTSAVEGANMIERGTLAAIQDVPKAHKGMIEFPPSIIAANILEGCGNLPLHDQGSIHIVDLEQQDCT